MKAGDIIRIPGHSRDWVALPVTRMQVTRRKGRINTRVPGLHLFGGAWYGTNLMNSSTFGKIVPAKGPHKIVGHVNDRRTLRGDLRAARKFKRSGKVITMVREREEFAVLHRKLAGW
jgi:hypothetical protein